MKILAQDGMSIYESDRYAGIIGKNNHIYLSLGNNQALHIASYENSKRVKEILEDMFAKMDRMSKYVMPEK